MDNEIYDDNLFLDIEKAENALMSNEIIMTRLTSGKCYFMIRQKKVFVCDVNVKYSLSIQDFKILFKDYKFLIYKHDDDSSDFDFSRDDEYYSWEHK